jgi:uncharacterized protein (TIGR02996 family)
VSDRAALFRAILADPDADAPRLAYAEWLAANGQSARAAFIRAQVAEAALPVPTRPADPWQPGFSLGPSSWTEPPSVPQYFAYTPHSQERQRLRDEINALRDGHAAELRGELPDDWPEEKPDYRRGFVEGLKIPVGQLARDPARYLDAAPITSLTLSWDYPFGLKHDQLAPAVAAIPQLTRLKYLGFYAAGREFVSAFVRAFAVMPEAARLRVLDLSRTDVEEETLLAVLYSDHLRDLHTLRLSSNTLSPEFLEVLGATEKLPGLRALDFGGCKLTPEGAERFFRGRLLGQLTGLTLTWNPTFGEGGAAALAACPHLARFRFLSLGRCALGDGGCRRLAESRFADNLEALNLGKCDVTGAGVAALLASDSLPKLNTLLVDYNPIDAAGVAAFASVMPAIPLRRLDLSNCPLGDDGARLLVGSPLLRSITHLRLRECGIGDAGATALAASSHLAELRELNLGNNPLTDAAAEALAASPALRNVERLAVQSTQITDRGGLRLTDLPGLKPYGLWISGDHITKRGEEKITKRLESRRKPT